MAKIEATDENGNPVDASIDEGGGSAMQAVSSNALATNLRAEIDTQIATAHAYPRSMSVFKRRATEMATLDEETAQSCIYNRPVGKKWEGGREKVEYASGLSVRMAEIVGAAYGNLRCGARLVEMTPRRVVAQGFAHDLETNFASSSEVVEATVKRDGSPMSEGMRVVIAKAALAKARRDAIFQVVPKALCKPIEDAARKLIVGDGSAESLSKRRAKVMAWVKTLAIDHARVFAALGIAGEGDIGLNELEALTGIRTAMRDGDLKVDEAFPETAAPMPAVPPASRAAGQKAAAKRKEPETVVTPPETRVEPANPAVSPAGASGEGVELRTVPASGSEAALQGFSQHDNPYAGGEDRKRWLAEYEAEVAK